jgi:chromosomal replication initiation ATPase DnaA
MGNILATMHDQHKARQLRISRAAFHDITLSSCSAVIHVPVNEPVTEEPERKPKGIFDTVLNEVCEYYNVRQEDILSYRQLNHISLPRHIVSYLLCRMTKFTTHQIAPRMNRDPSSIYYAYKHIEQNLEQHKSDLDILEARLKPLLSH